MNGWVLLPAPCTSGPCRRRLLLLLLLLLLLAHSSCIERYLAWDFAGVLVCQAGVKMGGVVVARRIRR